MILIAGPCVFEEKVSDTIVEKLLDAIKGKNIDFYFKASVIKDNRTSITKYGGIGMEKGIAMLLDMRKKYDVKITTDFHNEHDIYRYGSYVDIVQIPAYLAMQTSIIKAAAAIKTRVNFKKPQFLGPQESISILKKYSDFGGLSPIITDRGTMLGYNQTFMDPRHIQLLNQYGKVIVDTTHPNKNYPGWELNGKLYTESLAKSYISAGANGVFIETHPDLENAKCDGKTMYALENISVFIEDIYNLYKFINKE